MILSLSILAGAACVAPALVRRFGARALGWLALAPLASAGVLLASGRRVLAGERVERVLDWAPGLGAPGAFALDALSLLFGLVALVVGAGVLHYSGAYFAGKPRAGAVGAILLAFLASMLGVVLADDLITLFIAWEATGACSFLLIGFHGERAEARVGARRAMLVTAGGALPMLVGFLILADAAGTTRLAELGAANLEPATLGLVAALVLIGALTKSAQVPFTSWLPGAMAAPAPVSALLHAATLVKAGVFLVARFAPVLGDAPGWSETLIVLGAATTAVGGFGALMQTDVKRLLAFTTIAGLGAPMMLLGFGTPAAAAAALVLVVAHALYKSALFLAAGALEKAAGTRELDELGGVGRAVPVLGATLVAASLSMAGLAPALGFAGKELGFNALLGVPGLGVLLALLMAPQVACAWLVGARPLRGAVTRPLKRLDRGMLAAPALLAAAGIALGVAPQAALGGIVGASATLSVPASAAMQPLPGLDPWHVGLGLALSGLALALGAGLVFARSRWSGRTLFGERGVRLTPGGAMDAAIDALPGVGGRLSRALVGIRMRDHVALALAIALVLAAGPFLANRSLRIPADAIPALHELCVAGAVGLAVISALRLRSRTSAVATLGVAGAGMVLWFLGHGAPDLALTQFAVETLAVLLFVFALRGLPALRSGRPDGWNRGPVRRVRDGVLALGFGALATMLVWTVTSSPHPDDLEQALVASSVPEAHGRNIVNVILVDFRALDTLGEIFVLTLAAAGVVALLRTPRATLREDLP